MFGAVCFRRLSLYGSNKGYSEAIYVSCDLCHSADFLLTTLPTQGSSYALATFLSKACSQLNIMTLRDWQTGLPEYWGAVGHYSIANTVCGVIRNGNLKELMTANLERITYKVPDITKKNTQGLSKKDFVPLADVLDMVWKVGPHKRGGMKSAEHANHFADMDRRLNPKLPEGATLLEICDGKPENVAVAVWQRYYDAVQKQFPKEEESRGLLPFRVSRQIIHVYQVRFDISSIRSGIDPATKLQNVETRSVSCILRGRRVNSCSAHHECPHSRAFLDHPLNGRLRRNEA